MTAAQGWEVARGRRRRWPGLLVALLAAPALVLFARGGVSEPGIPLETPGPESPATAATPAPDPTAGEDVEAEPPEPVPPPVAAGSWHDLGDAPVSIPVDHHALWTGEELVVFGFEGEVAAYDAGDGRWRELPDVPLTAPTLYPPPVWAGTRLVVFSGDPDEAGGRLAAATLDPSGGGWRDAARSPLPALHEGVAVWTGRVVAVWGTVTAGQKVGAVYDPEADEWGSMPQAPVPAAERVGAVWTDREVVVYGRRYARPRATFAAAYDPYVGRWRRLPAPPLPNPADVTAVWTGRDVVVWSDGYLHPAGAGPEGAALEIDDREAVWRSVAAPDVEAAAPVQIASAGAWTGEHVALVGALSGDPGWLYHPPSDTWRSLPRGGGSRLRPAVAWTGERLLVWGGYTPLGPAVDLVAWEPDRVPPRTACQPAGTEPPAWASTTPEPLPDGWTRSDPAPLALMPAQWSVETVEWTAVAAGEGQLLLFAPHHGDRPAPLAGASLDLASGTWTCVPDAPIVARRDAVAVWTGEEVLVWGGHHASRLSDGAAFHPPTRSWRRLPPAPVSGGVPLAAAWTGTQLLLWGLPGSEPGAGNGAAYDPWANQWRRVPPGPGGLTRTSSVWTGQELLVLGLARDGDPPDREVEAAAYDPASDLWRAVVAPPLTPLATSLAESLGVVVGWDYAMGAASYDAAADAWEPLPAPPMQPGECWPASAALGTGQVFAWFCDQAALLDVLDRTWQPVELPSEEHRLLASGGSAVHAATRNGEILMFRP